ncbi:hypothetical protein RSPO_c01439 [Ralstonia solanacearum Po82]|uniref:Uncharacterized protein n=1 Tax=Ralstonia solanacearum (strain Po82) TaxID=1031711 RepID=F6G0F7_RALS8|nr:hypothetical protein RSPO_c01439 [Ralstonia solanacearum Po82]
MRRTAGSRAPNRQEPRSVLRPYDEVETPLSLDGWPRRRSRGALHPEQARV